MHLVIISNSIVKDPYLAAEAIIHEVIAHVLIPNLLNKTITSANKNEEHVIYQGKAGAMGVMGDFGKGSLDEDVHNDILRLKSYSKGRQDGDGSCQLNKVKEAVDDYVKQEQTK